MIYVKPECFIRLVQYKPITSDDSCLYKFIKGNFINCILTCSAGLTSSSHLCSLMKMIQAMTCGYWTLYTTYSMYMILDIVYYICTRYWTLYTMYMISYNKMNKLNPEVALQFLLGTIGGNK